MKNKYTSMGIIRDKIEFASNTELNYNKNKIDKKILKTSKRRALVSGIKNISGIAFLSGTALVFIANPILGIGLQATGAVGYYFSSEEKRKSIQKLNNLYKVKDAVEDEIEFRNDTELI